MLLLLNIVRKIQAFNCIGCCSSQPDDSPHKTSAKQSLSCKLPVHIESATLGQTAHQVINEARFKN